MRVKVIILNDQLFCENYRVKLNSSLLLKNNVVAINFCVFLFIMLKSYYLHLNCCGVY